MKTFDWLRRNGLIHTKRISGDTVDILIEEVHHRSDAVPYDVIDYGIYLHGTNTRIGYCDLRVGMNRELLYAGNIGYRIHVSYQGHGYAYDATKLLLQEAASSYEMKYVVITCSPDNIPSKRTLERLQGKFVNEVNVPKDHWLYQRGETVKDIYYFDLEGGYEMVG